jgi:hypothetical protein
LTVFKCFPHAIAPLSVEEEYVGIEWRQQLA